MGVLASAMTPDQLEQKRAYNRAYYKANREKLREDNHRRYQATREHSIARQTAYYAARREQIVQERREYRATRGELINARQRASYAANREVYLERMRVWREANPEKRADASSRRRARERNAPVVEAVDRNAIIARDKSRCHICGKRVPKAQIHLDHIVPLAAGGDHTAANLAVAHATCNVRKGPRAANDQLRLVG